LLTRKRRNAFSRDRHDPNPRFPLSYTTIRTVAELNSANDAFHHSRKQASQSSQLAEPRQQSIHATGELALRMPQEKVLTRETKRSKVHKDS
jgi:hypothetical protein